MGKAVFTPCCLTWGQTTVEVLKITSTSFNRPCACSTALSAPSPVAGHAWPTPLPETPDHSLAGPGQPLVGSLLFSPGSWCTQGLFVPSKGLFPQSHVSSGGSMVGLMATSSQESLCHTLSMIGNNKKKKTGNVAQISRCLEPRKTGRRNKLSLPFHLAVVR